jgi:hypothetical protein
MVKRDLHYVGVLMNPYLLHDNELADNNNSLIACKRVLQKTSRDLSRYSARFFGILI